MKILFLEDDPIIAESVLEFLSESYEVRHCFSSKEALACAEEETFSLYIFDINVPGISGIELLRSLRSFNDATPAIFITAYQELSYLTKGFNAGANDFIRKPFEVEELAVRIENIRRQFSMDTEIKIGESIYFNQMTHQIGTQTQKVSISLKESQILHYLVSHKNRVVSTEELLQNLWEYDEMPGHDTIRTYIKNLRQIVGKEHIVNIRAAGYRFE